MDRFLCVKPESCANVSEIERSRCRNRGYRARFTKIQCQVAKRETTLILFETLNAGFVLLRFKPAVAGQAHKAPARFKNQKDAREQFRSDGFLRQLFGALLAQQDA